MQRSKPSGSQGEPIIAFIVLVWFPSGSCLPNPPTAHSRRREGLNWPGPWRWMSEEPGAPCAGGGRIRLEAWWGRAGRVPRRGERLEANQFDQFCSCKRYQLARYLWPLLLPLVASGYPCRQNSSPCSSSRVTTAMPGGVVVPVPGLGLGVGASFSDIHGTRWKAIAHAITVHAVLRALHHISLHCIALHVG